VKFEIFDVICKDGGRVQLKIYTEPKVEKVKKILIVNHGNASAKG
jgi:hypothetical protein